MQGFLFSRYFFPFNPLSCILNLKEYQQKSIESAWVGMHLDQRPGHPHLTPQVGAHT